MSAWRRVGNLFRRAKVDAEIEAELRAHVEMRAEDNLAAGMSPNAARRDALVRFGSREAMKERVVGEDVALVIDSVWRDLKFACRQLTKNRGFAVTAILVLALGIGASTAIFAFVDAALIKPLPYENPTRLLEVTETVAMFGRANLSYQDYLDWKRMNATLSSLDVVHGTGYLLGGTGTGTEPVPGVVVSAGFFKTLGVKPMLGRDFKPDEDQPQAAKTVILSYGAWQRRFGGRKDVIGQTVNLTGDSRTIIGVLPPSFGFAYRGNGEFWTPMQVTADSQCERRRSCHNLIGFGRLRDGVTIAQAQGEFSGIAANLERQYPDSNRGQGASVISFSEATVGKLRPILLTLLGGAGLLLLIACVNVSSLLLVRSENRRREVSLRSALGASRARLLRQFITEGLLLVLCGGALGLGTAFVTIRVLLSLIQKNELMGMPYLQGLTLNLHTAAFAGLVCGLAAGLFSVTPLLRLGMSGSGMRDGLAEGSRGSSGTIWRRFGSNLVALALELAIAMVLLVGAGLLGKSFYKLLHVELGYQRDHVDSVEVILPEKQYAKDPQQIAAVRAIVDRVSRLPGVTSAAVTDDLVGDGNGNTDWIRFVGLPYDGKHIEVNQRDVSADYLKTLRVRLMRGRFFTDEEDESKPKVALVNEAFVRKYYPGEDPIGKRFGGITLAPDSIREIVGVVDDVHEGGLDQEIWPAEYLPFNQGPGTYMDLVARTAGDERAMLPTLAAAVHEVDPGIGVDDEMTLSSRLSESSAASLHRSAAWLVGGFAGLALLLSVIGLYGVIAYSVSQRTREIGVRMALGAARNSVTALILKDAGRLVAIGVGVGMACSVGAAILVRKLLFGTQAWDVETLVSVAVVLGASAMLASWVPARRAASVNPVEALRAE
jgi:macrolide transport system ATP-binding/permease protein